MTATPSLRSAAREAKSVPKVGTLTFDCYGTLIDWETGIVEAFGREAGGGFDRERLLEAYARCEAELEAGQYRSYGDVLAAAAACTARALSWSIPAGRAAFLAESLPRWRPFADTNPALERLSGAFRLGILSNVDDDLLAGTREHFAVAWDLVVTAQQVRSYKPRHAHWAEARRRLGHAAAEAPWIHVAQSYYHDVTPALELRLPIVWVNRRGERLRPDQARPTRETRDLAEAADFLLETFAAVR